MTRMRNQEIKEGKREQENQAEVHFQASQTGAEKTKGGSFNGSGDGKERLGLMGRGKMVNSRGFRE